MHNTAKKRLKVEITENQAEAVDKCLKSIASGADITLLCGYAGTGKTTIAKHIAEATGLSTVFAAPTGKAAEVMTRKGCNARTIHSLIYQPPKEVVRNGRRDIEWTIDDAKHYLASRAGLLVIDEASMVGSVLGNDIAYAFEGVPVLAIGDPAQLKPVNDKAFFMDCEPAYTLTDVIRNRGDILELATDIRTHGIGAVRNYPDINIGSIGISRAAEFDQIIVRKNPTRDIKNRSLREFLGFQRSIAEAGERIICLQNNYRIGCINGQQFTVTESSRERWTGDMWDIRDMRLMCYCNSGGEVCDACGWDSERIVPVWAGGFIGHTAELEMKRANYRISGRAMIATFGYVITAHKAQGSEWNSVLVVNEASGAEAVNWLYTSVTRAKSDLAVIRRSL